MKPHRSLPLLPLLLTACLGGEDGAEVLTPPGDPLPPIAGEAAPIREASVLQGFDPAAPAASAAGIQEGLSGSLLRFETRRLDLGQVYQFEQREFEFPFVVEGEEPVIVTNVDHNCGCTHSEIRADWLAKPGEESPLYVLGREIPPGAKGRVVGTYDAQRRRGIKVTTITLRGDMADTPVQLEIATDNLPVFDVVPATVRFGDVVGGPSDAPRPAQEIRVVARSPFEIVEWRRLPTGLKIEPVGEGETSGPRGEWARKFRLTLGSDAPEGLLSTSAVASTTLGIDLELIVNANVIGPISYTPPTRIAFGLPDLGEERTRTLEIRAAMDGLVIPTPTAELLGEAAAHMTAAVEVLEPGRTLQVKVCLPGTAPVGIYPGVLRLVYPEGSGIAPREFPISARVREKRG